MTDVPLPTREFLSGRLGNIGVDAVPAQPRCPHWGSWEGLSDPSSLPIPSSRAVSNLSRRKKPREAKGGCNKTFPGQFLPSFLFPPGPCWGAWDGRRTKTVGGEEGCAAHSQAIVPLACFEASGCSALHSGGRTWPRLWVISWQTQQGGCQGVLSSGR